MQSYAFSRAALILPEIDGMGNSLYYWVRVCVFNLLLVAFLGIILRYKIAFSFPYLDQRNLHHGHSHFAFTGWITQVLMVLMIHYLFSAKQDKRHYGLYRSLLFINIFASYGMLVSFAGWGYGIWSMSFSAAAILVSYLFAFFFIRDLIRLDRNKVSHWWFISALVFSVLSSAGVYASSWLMINRIIHQNWYLAAEYFYLHFQYNGWFFFAAMGLLVARLETIPQLRTTLKQVFWCFLLALVPAFFLSALWMPIQPVVYIMVVAAAILQFAGWGLMVNGFRKNKVQLGERFTKQGKWLLLLSATALTIKLFLQLGSTHPALSQLAFGFRPIVIGYLHLVLLGVITIFILGYLIGTGIIHYHRFLMSGAWVFVAGIVINELLLMLQGVMGMGYVVVPRIDEYLLLAAVVMFTGILILNLFVREKRSPVD